MVVSQRDSLPKGTGSEDNVTDHRPDGELPLLFSTTAIAAPAASGYEAAQQVGARRSRMALKSLLRLGTFAALRHREFRLLWAGQAATAIVFVTEACRP
jgi:hypothetical protein